MIPNFHIFKCDSDGTVIWREAVESLDVARKRVQILAVSCPGAFIIFNPSSGQEISLGKPDDSAPAKAATA